MISVIDALKCEDTVLNLSLFRRSRSCRQGKAVPTAKRVMRKNSLFNRRTFSLERLFLPAAERNALFCSRLSSILNVCSNWDLSRYKNNDSTLSSDLWKLASLSPRQDFSSIIHTFYVKSLSSLMSPIRRTQAFSRLCLSQIPGRGQSTEKEVSVASHSSSTPLHFEGETVDVGDKGLLAMLSRMVDNSVCSDLTICLDSGVEISAHRFIFAVWDPELSLLRNKTKSISAPGMSREELLKLLHALYTFDFSFFSALSASTEFTLDCWQMLDSVRSKIQSNDTFKSAVDNRESISVSNPVDLITLPIDDSVSGPNENSSSRASVDLFASMTEKAFSDHLYCPLSTHTISSQSTFCSDHLYAPNAGSVTKPFNPSQTSRIAFTSSVEQEKSLALDELDVDPPYADRDEIFSPSASLLCPTEASHSPAPCLNQCTTGRPDDVHTQRQNISFAPHCLVSDDYFSNNAVPTPVPLAKRLRISDNSTQVDNVILHCSQPPVLVSIGAVEGGGGEDGEDQTSDCLSQPVPATPIRKNGTCLVSTNVPITPKPAFHMMRTPELKKALSDYGIRQLPKKKAVHLLNHIYDELHPYVEAPSYFSDDESPKENRQKMGEPASNFGTPIPLTDVANSGVAESGPSVHITNQSVQDSKIDPRQTPSDELKSRVWKCLRDDDQMYFKIITYVPLELDSVKAALQEAGINIGLRRLSDMLDSWGVTFTTRNRHAPRPGIDASDPRGANYLW